MYTAIIADDERYSSNLIKRMVDWDNINIRIIAEAVNGIEALNLIKKYKPDIVITDIRMPGLDGIELLRQLYKEALTPYVIIISGYDEFSYAQEAVRYRAYEYLLKPFDPEGLTNVLMRITNELGKKRKEKEYVSKLKKQMAKMQAGQVDGSIGISDNSTHEIVKRSLEYIDQNYNQVISLEQVAEEVFVSSSYFSQLFKKELGIGFTEYLTNLRIEKAKTLLGQPFLKINEIASIVGYRDVAYFNRVFKSNTGHTPTEFREIKRKEK